jgi:hypothetical protein
MIIINLVRGLMMIINFFKKKSVNLWFLGEEIALVNKRIKFYSNSKVKTAELMKVKVKSLLREE